MVTVILLIYFGDFDISRNISISGHDIQNLVPGVSVSKQSLVWTMKPSYLIGPFQGILHYFDFGFSENTIRPQFLDNILLLLNLNTEIIVYIVKYNIISCDIVNISYQLK